jgi:hypothetical protein
MASGALTLDELSAIADYVDFATVENGGDVASSFVALVRDARQSSGRDLVTGQLEHVDQAGSWLGALGWLCLFDQIGQTVRVSAPTGGPRAGAGERFKACLIDFAKAVTKSERNDLWLLRNSLGHSFSLQAKDRDGNPLFKFVLDNGDTVPLVDRQHAASGVVVVNLREVGEVGETVVANIIAAASNKTLRLRGTVKELRSRYFIQVGVNVRYASIGTSGPAVTGTHGERVFVPSPDSGASASAFPAE